jgi:hypothetical protein
LCAVVGGLLLLLPVLLSPLLLLFPQLFAVCGGLFELFDVVLHWALADRGASDFGAVGASLQAAIATTNIAAVSAFIVAYSL